MIDELHRSAGAALPTYRVGEVSYAQLAELAGEAIGPEAREIVVTTAERLLRAGREEGRLEGERRFLLRLLPKRFTIIPKRVELRIAQATEAELETLSDRVVDATTIDEVFA